MGTIKNYLKLITTVAGTILLFWNQVSPGFASILPESWQPGIAAVVAVLTWVATFSVPGPNYVGKHERPA